MEGKPSPRPTENGLANFAPLRFRGDFCDNDARLVSCRVHQRNVKIAVCLDFHSNYAPRECEPIILDPGTL
jgi:hypothetical protein